jgi:hypothetical protein
MSPTANQICLPSAQASAPPRRSDPLWDKEIAQIRTARLTMTPTTIACVRTVLEAILDEVDLDPTRAASARQLLDEITKQASKTGHDTIGAPIRPRRRTA